MDEALIAETTSITGHGGDEIEAYLARPLQGGPYGGVVVIHHMPGYDAATKEIVRRFGAEGYVALASRLSCPLLGLFGTEDQRPSPAETGVLAAELDRLGKPYQFHTYDGAGPDQGTMMTGQHAWRDSHTGTEPVMRCSQRSGAPRTIASAWVSRASAASCRAVSPVRPTSCTVKPVGSMVSASSVCSQSSNSAGSSAGSGHAESKA
jgi:dienelactone hydrolase